MTAILTPAEITAHLESMTAVELRKLGGTMGIKGASKGKKAELVAAIAEIRIAELLRAEQEAEHATEAAKIEADTRALLEDDAPVNTDSPKRRRNAFGRSRAGMVIVAKGTELHKSMTFKAAAEAAGWHVEIEREFTGEFDEDGEPIERYRALATRAGSMVEGSWIGKAWDYAGSGAGIGGKARKVRNLKEALRILAGQA